MTRGRCRRSAARSPSSADVSQCHIDRLFFGGGLAQMGESGEKRGGGGAIGFVAAGLLVLAAAGGYLAYRAAHRTVSTNDYHTSTQPAGATQPTTRESKKPATKPK